MLTPSPEDAPAPDSWLRGVRGPGESGSDWGATRPALLTETAPSDIFKPWETAQGILLGVSGGPDSVALMLLAARWSRGNPSRPPVHVATVDHGLRKGSREEAEAVSRWAGALGLPHNILVWEGVKPSTRVQERAREARYALLFHHAAKTGADHVMTAHHADDQAETILFRLVRGSGVSGLAGMASSVARGGLTLARPLLQYPKAELVALCEAEAHPYFRDPSNDDPGYARTRIRHLGAILARQGFGRDALLRLGKRMARAETALAARARALRDKLDARREPGSFEADLSPFASEPEEFLLRLLADELNVISGKPLRLDRLEALAAKLGQALRAGSSFSATLGGAVFRLKSSRILIIVKEGRRRARFSSRADAEGREHGPCCKDSKDALGKGLNQA
ncbi:MAG TPA: tRNA lysidine(34) synthetase TilS [Methylocella sp.]|nr:tRNA lysidine(34) synthetase TilS [Methylocella sp.]